MDLYVELGVRKNASQESIKKAFRRRAKKAHPDVGGDPLVFNNIKIAYDVLSDPERRRLYDETGKYDSFTSEEDLSQVAQLIFASLRDLIGRNKDKIIYLDIIREVKQFFDGKIQECQKSLEEMRSIQSILREVSSRVTVEENHFNYISGMLDQEVLNIERAVTENEKQINLFQKCFDMLGNYKFDKKVGFYRDVNTSSMSTVVFNMRAW